MNDDFAQPQFKRFLFREARFDVARRSSKTVRLPFFCWVEMQRCLRNLYSNELHELQRFGEAHYRGR